ncbi:MAG: UDP-N-acetylmuramoyl-L-alanine--D-glutamate ligase [Betaproteobacteria bacterium]|nr:UDP-N-acetylmuramoyl-L-alanine--D-glutamate ligase [Betaproteobacteria bacterium]
MAIALKGAKVLVLGLGDTGLSMTRWLTRQGARVSAADTRAAPPQAQTLARELPQVRLRCGPFERGHFTGIDWIALSPGVDPRVGELAAALKRGVPAAGDVELFAQTLQTKKSAARVLAITGSNGKSTVTAMCNAMCLAAGLDTVMAGNIGLPVLEVLTEIDNGRAMPDMVVLELSSFQLETTASLRPAAATVLNLSEDHMDRYDSYTDYGAAKARIFAGGGVQVLNRDDALTLAMAREGRDVVTFGLSAPANDSEWGLRGSGAAQTLVQGDNAVMPVNELPLAGLHNAANALAAGALCRVVQAPHAAMASALRGFKGLPHRVEKVNKIKCIDFYDDSKGTNVGATVAALAGMQQPVVLIAGGDGKGQDFSPLAAVASRARAVVLIGRDAPLIAHALQPAGVKLLRAGGMTEAVQTAYRAAQAGDAVLLSPACASYDMFRNYVHRAEVFVEAVRQLSLREG